MRGRNSNIVEITRSNKIKEKLTQYANVKKLKQKLETDKRKKKKK